MPRVSKLLFALIFVGLASAFLALLMPPQRSRANLRRSSCQSQLKSIGWAFGQYRADYDGRFPLAGTGLPAGTAWTKSLQPHWKWRIIFDCPEGGALAGSPSAVTDYFYNLRLSQQPIKSLSRPAFTILAAEGEPASADYACWDFSRCIGQTASGSVGAVPESARNRHLDGENIAFTDGHVKWYQRSRQVLKPHPGDGLSFALK